MQQLKEGEDFYIEEGLYVFTEAYHLKRGYCCKSGCRHCPYGYMKKQKVAISWSGGKDSALALYYLLNDQKYEVDHLFTVFDKKSKRVGLHGVPEHLIERQAEAIGLPLKKLYLESSEQHDNYENLMQDYFRKLNKEGVRHVMYGDIFLDDLKEYRDAMLAEEGLKGVYPLWEKESSNNIYKFIELGFKTLVCAGKKGLISKEELGKTVDVTFIHNLSEEVDPSGENGEFHTFVYYGPILKKPVAFDTGDIIEKTYKYKSVDEAGNEKLHVSTFHFQEIY